MDITLTATPIAETALRALVGNELAEDTGLADFDQNGAVQLRYDAIRIERMIGDVLRFTLAKDGKDVAHIATNYIVRTGETVTVTGMLGFLPVHFT